MTATDSIQTGSIQTDSIQTSSIQAAPAIGNLAHSWFPFSPCDNDCLHPEIEVAAATRTWRIVRVLGVLMVALTSVTFVWWMPRPVRRAHVRLMSRMIFAALGITLVVSDERGNSDRGRRSALIVSNHSSYLDIPAIAAVLPACFVAKDEVCDWPVVGTLTRVFRVIPIMRGSLRALPNTVAQIAAALGAGDAVCAFPEGTTHCGRHRGRMRPAVFQSALDAGVTIAPVRLEFSVCGRPTSCASFIGDDGVVDTLRRVVGVQGLTVRVVLLPTLRPDGDRKHLALRAESLVFPPRRRPTTEPDPLALAG